MKTDSLTKMTVALLMLLLPVSSCGNGTESPSDGEDATTRAEVTNDGPGDDNRGDDLVTAPDADGEDLGDSSGRREPADVSNNEEAGLPDMASLPEVPAPEDTAEVFLPAEEVVEEMAAELPPTVPSDPGETGSFGVANAAYDLKIGEGWGAETVPLTIRLPLQPGSYPVIVFLHGFQLSPADYLSYGAHLASWGYVVVMPEMPSGTFGFGAPNHVELKGYLAAVLDWVEDDDAAGDGGTLQGKADPGRIGLAGHSMGGKISLLLATEDKRPLAVFALDPVDAAGGPLPVSPADYPSVTPELMGKMAIPIGLVGETLNGTCTGFMCQACAPEADNFHQYYLYATGPAAEIEVVGASHMSFLDNPSCGLICSVCPAGTDDTTVTRKLSRRYMTAFFRRFLEAKADLDTYLTGADMAQDEASGLVVSAVKNGL